MHTRTRRPAPARTKCARAHVRVRSKLWFKALVESYRLKEEDMDQEAAERLKAEEPWRITDNELELYKAKVTSRRARPRRAQPFLACDDKPCGGFCVPEQSADSTQRAPQGTLRRRQAHRHVRKLQVFKHLKRQTRTKQKNLVFRLLFRKDQTPNVR